MNRQLNSAVELESKAAKTFYLEARSIVADLFERKESIFWVDFVVSCTLAYTLISFFLAMPMSSPISWLCFVAGGLLIYRSSMFVHEIVHLPRNSMSRFRFFWNFFAGLPMLIPSFSYTSHTHHHSSRHYGTEEDGEYLPLASGTMAGIGFFLAQIIFQPILVYGRFLILTPLSFLHPRLRRWTLVHASSLVINFRYENHVREVKHTREDTAWELATWFRAMVMIALVAAGTMPLVRLPKLWMVAMFVLTLNHVRTLAAHRYSNQHGETMSHLSQFLDSTNITGNWLTELICPLGLRYHALHHLFPGIPYHNLGICHRRLTRELPADSVYHRSTYSNMRSVIAELFESIRQKRHAERQVNEDGSAKLC